jgi:hypothetical protein
MALIVGGPNLWFAAWLIVAFGMLGLMRFVRARG